MLLSHKKPSFLIFELIFFYFTCVKEFELADSKEYLYIAVKTCKVAIYILYNLIGDNCHAICRSIITILLYFRGVQAI